MYTASHRAPRERSASVRSELWSHLRRAVPVVLGASGLFVLQVACFEVDDAASGPVATPTADTRSTQPEPDARKEPIAFMHSVDQAKLEQTEARATCDGAEGAWTWTRFRDVSDLQRAQLAYSGAGGHDTWSYDFYFDRGDPAVLRHRVEAWSWIPGRQDGVTSDTVLERTYTVDEDGDVDTCRTATITAPSNVVEDALRDADRDPMPCADAGRVLALAERAEDDEKGWLNQMCTAKDPSPGLLRGLREDG